jgi:3-phosphoshikimate 1-carboxyvinyltransferase
MRSFLIKSVSHLKGKISFLGDKSIAHRAVILSAISSGQTKIKNFPTNKDCLFTKDALRSLGIKIVFNVPHTITVYGKGLQGLIRSQRPIYVGDSGTTLRLLLGVLAGQNFKVTLTAGGSLSKRPMLRVVQPLRMMGAQISAKRRSRQNAKLEEFAPITIQGGELKGITYKMPVASAQVKSAILLAGLYAKGRTQVIEPIPTRDHTERMLKLFKADIKVKQKIISITGGKELVSPGKIYIPGDISSASFFIVLALILPKSKITIKNISLNPTRMGIIRVLKRMGADIKLENIQNSKLKTAEPMGNIIVKSSRLKGTIIKKEEIPSLIDELPILMVAACFAEGKTVIQGVGELRVKETDRIRSMNENLTKMAAKIKIRKVGTCENIIIEGVKGLANAKVKSFGDHRTAMSLVVAGLAAKGKTWIDDISCIDKSFPEFLTKLKKII